MAQLVERVVWEREQAGSPRGQKRRAAPESKSPKTLANTEEIAFIYAPFRHFAKSQKSVKIGFDHSLSHFYAKTMKNRIKIGVWLSW